MAGFTHKYIIMVLLWSLHKDHHKKTTILGLEEERCFFFPILCHVSIYFFWLGSKPTSGMDGP